MTEQPTPLYVRLSADPNRRLQRAVSTSGKSKRQVVEDAVREYLTDDGLVVGRIALREELPDVMTLPEAAAMLRLEETLLRDAAERGELPGRLIGGEWRFSHDALMKWLGVAA
ncbi:MAG: helix-turn-helix domain-containing protein [Solirubrobacteraceae bacterium]